MKDKTINTVMFIAGAVIGSLVTWKYVKTKYERIAQEEIDSVKSVFRDQSNGITKPHAEEDRHEDCAPSELKDNEGELYYRVTDMEMHEYMDAASRYSSTADVSSVKNERKEGGTYMATKPYVISPDDFGELDGYETTTLTYYADGVLEDDYYIVIDEEEVDAMVGIDSFNHFGEHEADTVFVRNEQRKTDFEIQRDLRKYSETNHESLRNDL